MPEKEILKYLDKKKQERLRLRLNIVKGSINQLVVQYESLISGKWEAIVRYDTAHGFFHRDVLFPNGEKEKQTVNIDNLNDAVQYAEQDLKDRWDFYKSRYLKKLKK
jgi:hypothetical protein